MHIHPIWWWIIGGAVTAACWFLYQLAISDFDPFDQDKADWIEYQKQRD